MTKLSFEEREFLLGKQWGLWWGEASKDEFHPDWLPERSKVWQEGYHVGYTLAKLGVNNMIHVTQV